MLRGPFLRRAAAVPAAVGMCLLGLGGDEEEERRVAHAWSGSGSG